MMCKDCTKFDRKGYDRHWQEFGHCTDPKVGGTTKHELEICQNQLNKIASIKDKFTQTRLAKQAADEIEMQWAAEGI